MLRIRIFAAVLSLLALLTVGLSVITEAGFAVVIALLAAAICLAIIAPFDAPAPRQRLRILLASIAYLLALLAALALTYTTPASNPLLIALVLQIQLGVALTCWVVVTRKRRRMPHARRYFDN